MKFNEAIEKFNNNRAFRVNPRCIDGQDRDLRQFAIYMHDCNIEDVTDEVITEWLGYYKKMGYAIGTIIKKEEALIQFFKFYRRKGLDVVDPYLIPLTDKEFIAPKICTQEKYEKLLSVMPRESNKFSHLRNRAMVCLIWNTGMRIGEAAALNVADLDLENHLVKVKTEKSKGVRPFRVLPYDIFDQEAVETLPLWIEKRNELLQKLQLEEADILFFGVRTTKARGRRLAINAMGEIFAKSSRKAGMQVEEYVNAHSLRHHYGNELTRRHFNNSVISEAMGHSQISSSYRYTQLESGDLTQTLRGGKVLACLLFFIGLTSFFSSIFPSLVDMVT